MGVMYKKYTHNVMLMEILMEMSILICKLVHENVYTRENCSQLNMLKADN